MTYALIDDHFDDHPKYADLELEHFGLIACALTYCNRHLTDGRIPEGAVRRFGKSGKAVRLADRLVDMGHWRRVEGGFEVIGYLDHNPSRVTVLAKRAASRARKDAFRERHANGSGTRDGTEAERVPDTSPESRKNVPSPARAHSNPSPAPSPAPSPPPTQDPDPPVAPPRGGAHGEPDGVECPEPPRESDVYPVAAARRRGTRIPPDWTPKAAAIAWCRSEFRLRDPLQPLAEFVDYWLAVAGRAGVKIDWDATYRNRIRVLVDAGRLDVAADEELPSAPTATEPRDPDVPAPPGWPEMLNRLANAKALRTLEELTGTGEP